jgi:CBS domain-containing protein
MLWDETMSPEPTVASLVSTKLLKLPFWFTAGAALRIARLKQVFHLLVEDRRRIVGSVSRETLESMPPAAPLVTCMTVTNAGIHPSAPVHQAWARMMVHGSQCLPVFEGSLLVGLVTLEDVRGPGLGIQEVVRADGIRREHGSTTAGERIAIA